MKSIQMPIGKDYVSHWGFWEATREFLQNGIDRKIENPEAIMGVEFEDGELRIISNNTTITPQTLLLGNSKKTKDQIGQFGEGYKLGFVALLRLGYTIEVITGAQKWTPVFEYSDTFNCEVLTINMEPIDPVQSTIFIIRGVGAEERTIIESNYILEPLDTILKDRKGNIYVAGLFICKFSDIEYGYNLAPGRIQLGRDRNIISIWDLSYNAKSIIYEQLDEDELLDLFEKDSEEASPYIRNDKIAKAWTSKYGETIPVCNEEEIRALPSKVKYHIVPRKLHYILHSVIDFCIPKVKTPYEKLEEFIDNEDLTDEQKMKLTAILEEL